jgi:hypothetical protein
MTKISRSVFQHVVEQNKKLLRDIRIMSMEPGVKAILLRMRWRDRFKHDETLNNLLNKAAKTYFKEHPELMLFKK